MSQFSLTKKVNDQLGQKTLLSSEKLSVGRTYDNDLMLNSPNISAQHAIITLEDQQYFVKDLGSSNGTFINEKKIIGKSELKNGVWLRFGDITYLFQKHQDQTPTPTPDLPEIKNKISEALNAEKNHDGKTFLVQKSANTTVQLKAQEILKFNQPKKNTNWQASSVSFLLHIIALPILFYLLQGTIKEEKPQATLSYEIPPPIEKEEEIPPEEVLPEITTDIQEETASTMQAVALEENVLPDNQVWDSAMTENFVIESIGGAKTAIGQGLMGNDEIGRRLKKNNGKQKDLDIRATLIWHDKSDLDLVIITPLKEELSFNTRIDTYGGSHDLDKNSKPPLTNRPIENIIWPKKTAPRGEYEVHVLLYDKNKVSKKTIPFLLEIQILNNIQHYKGNINFKGDIKKVCTFNFGGLSKEIPYHFDQESIIVPFIDIKE